MDDSLSRVVEALNRLRAPFCPGEYDLHDLAAKALLEAGIPFVHEARLLPRCRIDFLAEGVGIEVKKGRPERKRLLRQLERYAGSEQVQSLVVLVERVADLPLTVGGKTCVTLSVNRMWGIAL
jgi:hypothetical protein